jgi:hypothetical protein
MAKSTAGRGLHARVMIQFCAIISYYCFDAVLVVAMLKRDGNSWVSFIAALHTSPQDTTVRKIRSVPGLVLSGDLRVSSCMYWRSRSLGWGSRFADTRKFCVRAAAAAAAARQTRARMLAEAVSTC